MNEGSKIRAGARRGTTGTRRARRRAIGIALVYALIGALWVPSSDWALRQWVDDPELLALLQTWKGWFFTAISSLVLFLVVHLVMIIKSGFKKQMRAMTIGK